MSIFPLTPPLVVARAVLAARRRVLDLADAALPGEFALFLDIASALQRPKIAGVLVSSGLADALGSDARDPADLAHQLELDLDVTTRIVAAAIALRLMRRDRRGRVRLSRLGAPLRKDHPKSIASWVTYYAHPDTSAAFAHMDMQLREGAQISGYGRAFGKSMWEYFSDHPEVGAAFADAMRQLTQFDLAGIVRAYPWPSHGVICDVAGGKGHLLAAILEHRPQARGILLDAPEVVAQADGFLRDRGVIDRVEPRVGDLFGQLDAQAETFTR